MLTQLYIELLPRHLLKMTQRKILFSVLVSRGSTYSSHKIQLLMLKSQVSSFLKPAVDEDCFFRNEVIHTEDSAAEDQNTVKLEEKQDHVSVPESTYST